MDIDFNAFRITHDLRYRFNLQDRRVSWNTYIRILRGRYGRFWLLSYYKVTFC